MQKFILTISILFISGKTFAQTTEAHYYKDEYLSKETTEAKAQYIRTVTQFPDGTKTTEVKYLATDEVIRRESLKGDEPVGVWIVNYGSRKMELNYDFELVYSEDNCQQDITLTDYFKDDTVLLYKAPGIPNGLTIYQYLNKFIDYPRLARDNGLEGMILLTFMIGADGKISEIKVKRGVAPILDKESVRVIREFKFLSPPMLDEKAISVCVTMPLAFSLE